MEKHLKKQEEKWPYTSQGQRFQNQFTLLTPWSLKQPWEKKRKCISFV